MSRRARLLATLLCACAAPATGAESAGTPLRYEYYPGERFTVVLDTRLEIRRVSAEGTAGETTVEEKASWIFALTVADVHEDGAAVIDVRVVELDHRAWTGRGEDRRMIRYRSRAAGDGALTVYRVREGAEPEPITDETVPPPAQRRLVGQRWRCTVDPSGSISDVRRTDVPPSADGKNGLDADAAALFAVLWVPLPEKPVPPDKPLVWEHAQRLPLLGSLTQKISTTLRDAQDEEDLPAVDVSWRATILPRKLTVGLDLKVPGLPKPEAIRAEPARLRARLVSCQGTGSVRLLAVGTIGWSLEHARTDYRARIDVSLGRERTHRLVRFGRELRVSY